MFTYKGNESGKWDEAVYSVHYIYPCVYVFSSSSYSFSIFHDFSMNIKYLLKNIEEEEENRRGDGGAMVNGKRKDYQ